MPANGDYAMLNIKSRQNHVNVNLNLRATTITIDYKNA